MTLAITYLSPGKLWLLALVAALGVVYVVLQTRRRTYAVRFTNLDLLLEGKLSPLVEKPPASCMKPGTTYINALPRDSPCVGYD